MKESKDISTKKYKIVEKYVDMLTDIFENNDKIGKYYLVDVSEESVVPLSYPELSEVVEVVSTGRGFIVEDIGE